MFIWRPRPHQKPGSVGNPIPPSAAKPAPATPTGRAGHRSRSCPEPTSGSRAGLCVPAPRPWAESPEQTDPPLTSQSQPCTCCASCPDPSPAPALHWLFRAFLLPLPRDQARLRLHVTRGGPPLFSGASREWRDWDAREERLRWSGRRAGVMKREAKVKPLVEG